MVLGRQVAGVLLVARRLAYPGFTHTEMEYGVVAA